MADSLAALNMLPKPVSFQGFGYTQGGVNVVEGSKAAESLAVEQTAVAESAKDLQSARDELTKQQAELQKKTDEKNKLQTEKTRLEGERTSKQSALSSLKTELASAQAAVQAARAEAERRAREAREDAARRASAPTTGYQPSTYIPPAPLPMQPFQAEIQRNVQISPSVPVALPPPPPAGAAVFVPSKPAPAPAPAPVAPPPAQTVDKKPLTNLSGVNMGTSGGSPLSGNWGR